MPTQCTFLRVPLFLITARLSVLSTSIRSNYFVYFAFTYYTYAHLYNKVPDISLLLNQSSQLTRLFGISETRLGSRTDSNSIRIPTYCVMRRDSTQTLHTGIALYIHQSIAMFTRVELTLHPKEWNVGRDKLYKVTIFAGRICL